MFENINISEKFKQFQNDVIKPEITSVLKSYKIDFNKMLSFDDNPIFYIYYGDKVSRFVYCFENDNFIIKIIDYNEYSIDPNCLGNEYIQIDIIDKTNDDYLISCLYYPYKIDEDKRYKFYIMSVKRFGNDERLNFNILNDKIDNSFFVNLQHPENFNNILHMFIDNFNNFNNEIEKANELINHNNKIQNLLKTHNL